MKLEEIKNLKVGVFMAFFSTFICSIIYVYVIFFDHGNFYRIERFGFLDFFLIIAALGWIGTVKRFSEHKEILSRFADQWIQDKESKVKEKMLFHLRLFVTFFAVLSFVLLVTILVNKYYLSGAIFTSVSLLGFVGFLASRKKLEEEISFSRISALKSIVMIQIPISKYQELGIYNEEADLFDLNISEKKQTTNKAGERNYFPASGES